MPEPLIPKNLFSGAKLGDPVRVRPCSDEKTYIGVMLGDIPTPCLSYHYEKQTLMVKQGMRNPAMYVPELNKVVMGYSSWWSQIGDDDSCNDIEDSDINNTLKVLGLK